MQDLWQTRFLQVIQLFQFCLMKLCNLQPVHFVFRIMRACKIATLANAEGGVMVSKHSTRLQNHPWPSLAIEPKAFQLCPNVVRTCKRDTVSFLGAGHAY